MSNKSTFKTPIKHATLQRNAFDLSRRDIFSVNAGELTPVCFIEVNPNEHFEIRPDIFLRTQTMNTAAYARAKQKIEFFFVPYRALWSKSDQFFTGSNYTASSIFNKVVPTGAPRFPLTPSTTNSNPACSFYSSLVNWYKQGDHSAWTDIFGSDSLPQIRKLMDMMGYGLIDWNGIGTPSAAGSAAVGQYATPFRALAYQKIYQDFYRLPLYEPYDNACNIDDLQGTSAKDQITLSVTDDNIKRLFTPRYHSWKYDYFTNVRAQSTLYMSLWMSDLNTENKISSLYPNPALFGGQIQATSSKGTVLRQSVYTVNGGSGYSFDLSASSVRAMFALERMLDSMSRAKDGTYSAQIEARFGVKPLIDPHLSSTYLGGSDAPVVIGEVTSTAQTSDVAGDTSGDLGRVAGKGTSQSKQNAITFSSKEHGLIVGVFSIIPEAEYNAMGIDPMVQKFQKEDYFTPELDKLGFAPVTMKQLFAYGTGVNYGNDDKVVGFNPMYSEYKTAVDKVHGDFVQGGSLSAWCTPRMKGDVSNILNSNIDSGFSLRFLKINPSVMDSIFAVSRTQADQFLVNCWLDIRAIRPMSVNGLPYCN